MVDIADTLQDKAGPFPIWVWGALLGGVAVGFMYLHRDDSSAMDGATVQAGVSPDAVLDLQDDALYTGDNTGDQYSNNIDDEETSPVGVGDDGSTTIKDNASWFRLGVAFLIGNGFNPLTSSRALTRYLDSKRLNVGQGNMVGAVITRYGLPPNPPVLAAGSGAPVPSTSPLPSVPKLPLTHVVKGSTDNSPGKLAVRYYGNAAGQRIRDANPNKVAPYPKGSHIYIPKWSAASTPVARQGVGVPAAGSNSNLDRGADMYVTRTPRVVRDVA